MHRLSRLVIALCVLIATSGLGFGAENGLNRRFSPYPVAETVDRLEAAIRQAGNTVFARIDHAAGARGAGLEMAPTVVIIFGNPKAGTPLMKAAPSLAIDLPQKFLVWQNSEGKTEVAWNSLPYLAVRHGLADPQNALAGADKFLDALTTGALGP